MSIHNEVIEKYKKPKRMGIDQAICNNRQCNACVYCVGKNGEQSCDYIGLTGHSRGCDIPFCDKFELKKGHKRPKNLTAADFKEWHKVYGEKGK